MTTTNRDTDSLCRIAAQACLVQCRQSTIPFTVMADFLESLRARGWSEASIFHRCFHCDTVNE